MLEVEGGQIIPEIDSTVETSLVTVLLVYEDSIICDGPFLGKPKDLTNPLLSSSSLHFEIREVPNVLDLRSRPTQVDI